MFYIDITRIVFMQAVFPEGNRDTGRKTENADVYSLNSFL